MGYRLNRLDEPVFMAVPKPMLTEFGIHYRLESCASYSVCNKETTKGYPTLVLRVSRKTLVRSALTSRASTSRLRALK